MAALEDPSLAPEVESEPTTAEPAGVVHLSRADRVPLAEVLGGSESAHMTPAIASHLSVLDDPLSCWMVDDTSQMEVNLIDRYLDILAAAEIPGTGEQVEVAIENQYGTADPDHFGRLIGWYMPETGAQMGVLIAEDFAPQLLKAITDGQVVRPEHGLWLIEAAGYVVNGQPLVSYTTRATSLPRSDLLQRRRLFTRRGAAGVSGADQAEANRRAAALFAHIARTSSGWLGRAVQAGASTSGPYRWIHETGNSCHLSFFVGVDRISIGSCYLKGNFDEQTLEALVVANQSTEVDPEPARRYLRGAWWDIRLDVGRDTPADQLPADLGDDLERAIDAIRPALDEHQAALLKASQSGEID